MGDAKKRLASILEIEDGQGKLAELPLFHVMPGEYFASLIEDESRHLDPRPCKHFKQNLIYGSYGRPSYRIRDTYTSQPSGGVRSETLLPVVFVFSPGSISEQNVNAVYPFDTGGLKNKLYAPYMGENVDLDLFLLPCNFGSIRLLIEKIYQSNSNYFRASPKARAEDMGVGAFNFAIKQYLAMIHHEGPADFDDRCSVVEVHINNRIDLDETNVDAIILPQTFSDEPICQEVAEIWDAELLPYLDGITPIDAHQSVIFQKAWDYINQKGWG